MKELMNLGTLLWMSALILMAGCASVSRTTASATEDQICRELGEALPTRSKQDTQTTIDEITLLYAVFVSQCPDHEKLIPNRK